MIENMNKMNVLVLGASGVGKSTLIKSISGLDVETGVGEGQTQKVDVFESETWPLRLIDSKGFEYSLVEQIKTIHQIKKFTKEQIKLNKASNNTNEIGIDAVWYCIDGTSRRTFTHNIELMSKSIKGWKNIPVFAILTKSYSKKDIEENTIKIKEAFSKCKNVNLKEIIPVVAEEYQISEDMIVTPFGLEELCIKTLEVSEESNIIKKDSMKDMILNQKRFTAHSVTVASTIAAGTVGAIPLNFADAELLVPLEIGLTTGILKIYNVKSIKNIATSIVSSNVITYFAKKAVTTLKLIPGVGDVINAIVAGTIVLALGEAVIYVSEKIYLGQIKEDELEKINDQIKEKLNYNVVLNKTVEYLEKNKDKINNKNTKEILRDIVKINTSTKKSK